MVIEHSSLHIPVQQNKRVDNFPAIHAEPPVVFPRRRVFAAFKVNPELKAPAASACHMPHLRSAPMVTVSQRAWTGPLEDGRKSGGIPNISGCPLLFLLRLFRLALLLVALIRGPDGDAPGQQRQCTNGENGFHRYTPFQTGFAFAPRPAHWRPDQSDLSRGLLTPYTGGGLSGRQPTRSEFFNPDPAI